MWMLLTIPFLLQAIAILVDEGYFHYKRGLPKWERIGHPLDTFTVLLCLSFVLFCPYSEQNSWLYTFFAILSCVAITKDEFVHKEHCPGSENLLHAFLFILHPITLFIAFLIWQNDPHSVWLDNPFALRAFLWMQSVLMFLFFIYQIVFWNLLWQQTR